MANLQGLNSDLEFYIRCRFRANSAMIIDDNTQFETIKQIQDMVVG